MPRGWQRHGDIAWRCPSPWHRPSFGTRLGFCPPLEFSVLGGFIPIPTPTLELCPFWGQSGDNDPCQPSQGAMGGCDLPRAPPSVLPSVCPSVQLFPVLAVSFPCQPLSVRLFPSQFVCASPCHSCPSVLAFPVRVSFRAWPWPRPVLLVLLSSRSLSLCPGCPLSIAG